MFYLTDGQLSYDTPEEAEHSVRHRQQNGWEKAQAFQARDGRWRVAYAEFASYGEARLRLGELSHSLGGASVSIEEV